MKIDINILQSIMEAISESLDQEHMIGAWHDEPNNIQVLVISEKEGRDSTIVTALAASMLTSAVANTLVESQVQIMKGSGTVN